MKILIAVLFMASPAFCQDCVQSEMSVCELDGPQPIVARINGKRVATIADVMSMLRKMDDDEPLVVEFKSPTRVRAFVVRVEDEID